MSNDGLIIGAFTFFFITLFFLIPLYTLGFRTLLAARKQRRRGRF